MDAERAAPAAQGAESDAPPADAGEPGEARRRGRGRDRNRRDRTDSGDQGGPQADAGGNRFGEPTTTHAAAVAAAPFEVSHAAPSASFTADETVAAAASEPAPWRPAPVEAVVPASPPTVAEPAPVMARAVVAAEPAAPAPAPVKAEPFVLPVSSLQAVVESSGLQWVGSDAGKIRAVREAMASEPPPAHVPRERKPMAKLDDGPLVLVETRKDLSQFKLPFETAAQEAQPPQ